jgi:hypothetical protein
VPENASRWETPKATAKNNVHDAILSQYVIENCAVLNNIEVQ